MNLNNTTTNDDNTNDDNGNTSNGTVNADRERADRVGGDQIRPAATGARITARRGIVTVGRGAICLGLLLPFAACGRGADASTPEIMPDVAALTVSKQVDCDPAVLDGLEHTPTCYEVSVPEDWSSPTADSRVVLAVAVFTADSSARSGDQVSDPLIYLEGGPGGAVIENLPYTESGRIDPYLATRDVIMFDQRGVGASTPSLACDEENSQVLDALDRGVAGAELSDAQVDAAGACHARLEADGVNFAAYNSVASAHDIEAIRTALGYERLNVWGISYGTRLAQTFMRLYPSSIRAAVIDSVEPVAADVNELIPVSSKRSIQMLFDSCAADTACSEAYPDLEGEFFTLVDKLNKAPADVAFSDADGNEHSRKFTGDDLADVTFGAMYDQSLFAAMPEVIARATAGDFAPVGMMLTNDEIQTESFSLGMFMSVVCHEEVPFESRDDLADNGPDDPNFGRLAVFTDPATFDVCDGWKAGRAPDVENQAVDSDIPTLVLTGTFDPITPPEYAEQVAEHLDNSYLYEFPTEGHGVSSTDCATTMIGAFLADPSTAPDASCIAEVPAPAWTPRPTPIELTAFEISDWGDAQVTLAGERPEGWSDVGFGDFRRGETFLDATQLLVLPINGATSDGILGRLGDVEFDADTTKTVDVNGDAWEFHAGDAASGPAVAVLISPAHDKVVVLVASPTEIDDLVKTVAVPVSASLAVS